MITCDIARRRCGVFTGFRHDDITVQRRSHRFQRAAAWGSKILRFAARLRIVAYREKVFVTRRTRRLRIRSKVIGTSTIT